MLLATFRLAGYLGKTLDELDISYDEFTYWCAFLKLEPPEEAANMRTAMLLSQITNMSGKSLREGRSVTPDDFLGKPKPAQSLDDQIAFFKSMSNK